MCSFQPQNFLSDLGGVLGLWLGMSILTLFEYVEFLIDMVIFSCIAHFRKNRVKSMDGALPQKSSLGGALPPKLYNTSASSRPKSVGGSSECLVGTDDGAMGMDQRSRSQSLSYSVAGERECGSHMDDISEHSADEAPPSRQSRRSTTPEYFASPSRGQSERRRASMPYYNMKSARSTPTTALSARQVSLSDQEPPVEMEGLTTPPPPYSSRRGSETSSS